MSALSSINTKNTSSDIERLAQSIVVVVDHLYFEYGLCAFVKLNTAGAADCIFQVLNKIQHSRTITYLKQNLFCYVTVYIIENALDQHLTTHTIVE
ncbi:unnamed protein product [Rotaria sp. Silwood2]|nr:unnamed protein product [Rotaria sp. Silwood2]CAF4537315.1 unnamed protein product [Rotaria sp. Silwood2]